MKGLLSQQGEILQFCTQSCCRSNGAHPERCVQAVHLNQSHATRVFDRHASFNVKEIAGDAPQPKAPTAQ